MKSTPKTREAAYDKIKEYLSHNNLSDEESQELSNVLGVIEDAKEYAAMWKGIDMIMGYRRVGNITTFAPNGGVAVNHAHVEAVRNILDTLSNNIQGKNLY